MRGAGLRTGPPVPWPSAFASRCSSCLPSPPRCPRRSGRRGAVPGRRWVARSATREAISAAPTPQRVRSRQGALTGVYMQLPLDRSAEHPAGDPVRPEGRAGAGGRGGRRHGRARHRARLPRAAGAAPGGPTARAVPPVVFGGPAPSLQIGCDVQIADPNTPVRATCEETDLPAFRAVRRGPRRRRRAGDAVAAVGAGARGAVHDGTAVGAERRGCEEPVVWDCAVVDVLRATGGQTVSVTLSEAKGP